ncbi:hypothetical protein D3C71_1020980 [compost metagenome]
MRYHCTSARSAAPCTGRGHGARGRACGKRIGCQSVSAAFMALSPASSSAIEAGCIQVVLDEDHICASVIWSTGDWARANPQTASKKRPSIDLSTASQLRMATQGHTPLDGSILTQPSVSRALAHRFGPRIHLQLGIDTPHKGLHGVR